MVKDISPYALYHASVHLNNDIFNDILRNIIQDSILFHVLNFKIYLQTITVFNLGSFFFCYIIKGNFLLFSFFK